MWRFQTGGRVKGAVAALGNRVFVGSYDGRLSALDSRTGALQWRTSSQDRFGGRGRFYSTPAVSYGRVFIGSTDGKVYAFGASTGDLLWSRSTGGYVYSSPAVWEKLVLVGSYSGSFFAIDAATGEVRWRFAAGGRISGAPTVMAGNVYFATLVTPHVRRSTREPAVVCGRSPTASTRRSSPTPIMPTSSALARVFALTEKR